MAEGIRKKIEKMKKEVEDANDKAGEAELGKKEALAYAEKMEQESNDLKRKITMLETDIDKVENKLESAQDKIAVYEKQLDDTQRESSLAAYRHKYENASEELDRRYDELKEAEASRDKADSSVKDLEGRRRLLEDDLQFSEESLDEAKAKIENLESELDAVTRDRDHAMNDVTSLENKLEKEQANCAEANDKLADTLASLQDL